MTASVHASGLNLLLNEALSRVARGSEFSTASTMTASASAVSEVKRIAGQPRIVLVRHAESEFNRMEEEYISAFRPELRNMPEHWDTDEVFDPHVWVCGIYVWPIALRTIRLTLSLDL